MQKTDLLCILRSQATIFTFILVSAKKRILSVRPEGSETKVEERLEWVTE